MAKDFGGNDDRYENFYPGKLKIKLELNKDWPRDGSQLTAFIVYDGKVISENSIWLDVTVTGCNG
jgi:hypothetical protein